MPLPTASSRNQIERVQCKFLGFAVRMLHIDNRPYDYEPVLKLLELSTLVDKRVSINEVFLRKLINGSIDYPKPPSQVNFKIPSFQLRTTYPFFIPLWTTNYFRNRPMFRLMYITNEDPSVSFC